MSDTAMNHWTDAPAASDDMTEPMETMASAPMGRLACATRQEATMWVGAPRLIARP